MENKFEIFSSAEFGSVRTLETTDGKVLFCGADVAKALGYVRPNDAISAHCKCTVKCSIPHPQSPNKEIEMTFITEGDMYRLITHSKRPDAERFESWVFDEVLPSIRKKGSYTVPQMSQTEIIAAMANNAVELEKRQKTLEIRQQAIEERTEKVLDVFTMPTDITWHETIISQFKKICYENNLNYHTTLGSLYSELEHEAKCDLTARQRNKRKRMKQAGYTQAQTVKETSKIMLIEDDDDALRLAFENIFRKFQVKYLGKEHNHDCY